MNKNIKYVKLKRKCVHYLYVDHCLHISQTFNKKIYELKFNNH